MTEIKIALIYKHQYTALEHYRQETPHDLLQYDKDTKFTPTKYISDGTIDHITDEQLQGNNIIQFIRHIDQKGQTKEAVDRCHKLGMKVVFDIDDYWQLDSSHKLCENLKRNNYTQTVTDAINHADWVTTTTTYLADEIKKIKPSVNVTVLPNCISPIDKQWERTDITNSRLRFGWVGGVFHLPDIKLLENCFKKIALDRRLHDKVQICSAGFNIGVPSETELMSDLIARTKHYIANRKNTFIVKEKFGTSQKKGEEFVPEYVGIERIMTGDHKLINYDKDYREYLDLYTPTMEHLSYDKPYRRIWSRDVNNYGGVYNEVDVCLVPLRDVKFNRCKSELKIIEAGVMGKSVIVSDVTPYKEWIKDGENGLIATNWYDEIKYMIDNPEHRKEMAEALTETVAQNFNPLTIGNLRGDLYKHLCK